MFIVSCMHHCNSFCRALAESKKQKFTAARYSYELVIFSGQIYIIHTQKQQNGQKNNTSRCRTTPLGKIVRKGCYNNSMSTQSGNEKYMMRNVAILTTFGSPHSYTVDLTNQKSEYRPIRPLLQI